MNKVFLVIIIILILVLGLIACSNKNNNSNYSDEKFKVGQVWKYNNRAGEDNSTIKILKIEKDEKLGIIVHIAIDNVKIKTETGKVKNEIGHMPFAREAVEKSVTKLEKDNQSLPKFEGGYNDWKSAFDKGKAGIWSISVAEAVKAMEEDLNKGK